jgi:methylated-DNA-[protein]-cysteine S-methyltransferase
MTLAAATVATPAGPLSLLVDDDGLRGMGFTDDPEVLRRRLRSPGPMTVRSDLGAATDAVRAYLDGDLTAFDALPVVQDGGPFLREAWDALRRVPAGQTVTYTELARRAGRPAAVRAAASACARNLVAPAVPCHRVVRTDGSLGGYYWGLPVKRWLIAHEARWAA